jgi:triosephosphate isomerase
MRKPMVAGNWKMNKTVLEARQLIKDQLDGLRLYPSVERVLCLPFTALNQAAELLNGSGIGLGAQNLHWEASGAYTGEISASMLKEFCQYVIVGHSERRTYFGETDATVNKKIRIVLANGLVPIVCVGETLAENEAGETGVVLTRQILEGLQGLKDLPIEKIVLAYEPVWAIGTGRAASGLGANDVIGKMIRPAFARLLGEDMPTECGCYMGVL